MSDDKSKGKPKKTSSAFSLISKKIELEIQKLTFGGDGLCRKDNLVYFVPFSAPGDQVEAEITEVKKNFSRAKITSLKKKSPYRVSPECPVFQVCGGCQWQHISYSEQVNQKSQIVNETLRSVIDSRTVVHPLVPSKNPWRYRNRIQLKFDGKNLGFHKRGTNEVINIEDCLISETLISAEISKLRDKLISEKSPPVDKIELFLDKQNNIHKRISQNEVDSSAFSQVNTEMNQFLVNKVLECAEDTIVNKYYDLYSGSGNFSFPIINKFSKSSLVAVELSSSAVEKAKKELVEKNISGNRARFYCGDVELFLKRQPLHAGSVVIIDPPRIGCSELTMKYLGKSQIKKLIYVSCNPSTLIRDIQRLKNHGNWKLSQIQAFDMFPHTSHIEIVSELVIDTE